MLVHDWLGLKSAASVRGIYPPYISASIWQKDLIIIAKCYFGQGDSTEVDKLHIKVKICILQSLDHNLQIILAFASHSN